MTVLQTNTFAIFHQHADHDNSDFEIRSASSAKNSSNVTRFLFGPDPSPPLLPVWAQIVILHAIALILAVGFFYLRGYVISKLNTKHVDTPQRRYTERRNAVSGKQASVGKTTSSKSHNRRLASSNKRSKASVNPTGSGGGASSAKANSSSMLKRWCNQDSSSSMPDSCFRSDCLRKG